MYFKYLIKKKGRPGERWLGEDKKKKKKKGALRGPLFCLFLLLCNYWRTSIFSSFFRFNNWFSGSGFICSIFSSGGTLFNWRWDWVWLSTTISTWANTRDGGWWSVLNRHRDRPISAAIF